MDCVPWHIMHYFLTVALIAVSADSNSGEYTMVIISNATIGGVIIPNRKADNTTKIRYCDFKGYKSCYYMCDKLIMVRSFLFGADTINLDLHVTYYNNILNMPHCLWVLA